MWKLKMFQWGTRSWYNSKKNYIRHTLFFQTECLCMSKTCLEGLFNSCYCCTDWNVLVAHCQVPKTGIKSCLKEPIWVWNVALNVLRNSNWTLEQMSDIIHSWFSDSAHGQHLIECFLKSSPSYSHFISTHFIFFCLFRSSSWWTMGPW